MKVKAFCYDSVKNMLLMIKSSKSKKNSDKRVQLIDINEQHTIYSEKVYNTDLYGRIKSQNLTFVDGHIYYGNCCIKIRYDVIYDKKIIRDLREEDVFDYFDEVLKLEKG